SPGASVQVGGHTITVTELDGRRIARLRVAPRTAPANPANPANAAAVPAARSESSEQSQVEGGSRARRLRYRARRGLRCAVRAADRPPGARVPRLLRDRPLDRAGAGHAGPAPEG